MNESMVSFFMLLKKAESLQFFSLPSPKGGEKLGAFFILRGNNETHQKNNNNFILP